MTLRVYRTNREVAVTEERALFHFVAVDRFDPYGLSQDRRRAAIPG